MAPPKDIARSYPKRGLTADVGFRSEPKFCGDGSTDFDGSSDFATATTYDGGGTETTMVYWIKADSTAGTTMPFANGGASNSRNQLQTLITGGVLRAADAPTNIPFSIDANRWYMLAIVGDSGGLKKAYLDGIDGGSPVSYGHSITATSLTLGARATGPTQPFNGKLARFRIFNVELTQDQIRELYNNPGLEIPTGLTSSNLRRNYRLETDFNDSGADSENATASGSPSFTVNRPQLPRGLDLARGAAMARVYTGRAVDFDGSVDYLETTLDSGLGSGFSVSLWFLKQTTTGSNNYLFSSGASGTGNFISLSCTSGVNALAVYDLSTFLTSSLQANLNQWHHAVLTVGTGANSYTVYLDGIGESLANTASPNITNADFELGRYSSGSTHYHDGFISDVKVFDQVLTADQVKDLYHYPEKVLPTGVSASNLIHRWALSDYNDATAGGMGGRYFQDSAGNNALEDKGSSSMSFAQPVPCPQLGLQQSATRLLFPGGTTTHNAVATTAALGTNASVSCWLQCNNTSPVGIIWSVGLSGTNHWYVYIQSGNIIIGPGNITIGTVTEGAWTHLVVTTDSGSPPYKAYVNGAEVSLTGSDTARSLTSGSFEIGNQDVASSPFVFTGILNDVACWNTELSLSDAQSLYNSGVMGMDVSTVQSSNLKGWWKCDDFTTLKDYSGNGANATVTNTFNAASFPENASGSTIVGDFSMKRKGVSVLNFFDDSGNTKAVIPAGACEFSTYPDGGSFSLFFRMQKHGTGSNNCFFTNFGTTATVFASYPTGTNIRSDVSDGATRLINTIASPLDSEWHHLAGVLTYGSPASFKIYLDGVLTGTNTGTLSAGIPTTLPLTIGSYGGNFENTGSLACMRFYKTSLSNDEIEQIYRSDLRLIKGLENV